MERGLVQQEHVIDGPCLMTVSMLLYVHFFMTHMSNLLVDIVRQGIVKGSHGDFTLWPRAMTMKLLGPLKVIQKLSLWVS